MFIDSKNYKSCVTNLIEGSASVKIAVAFWGKDAEKMIESKNKEFKILCNLTSGGTNPEVVKKIREWTPQVTIKHHEDLHAKVFIGENSVIVGSANMSTNGLNIESDQFDGWQEAGYLTNESKDIADADKWFDERWGESAEITGAMMAAAAAAWKKRSTSRISRPYTSLLDMTPAEARGVNIYVAFYHYPKASDTAQKGFDKLQSEIGELASKWDFFSKL